MPPIPPFIPARAKMAQAAPPAMRDTVPGTQPMAGPPMPPHNATIPPKGKVPHHRANIMAKSKTKTAKHVIPPPGYGRAKPSSKD